MLRHSMSADEQSTCHVPFRPRASSGKNEFMDPELREREKIAPKPVLQADLGEVLHLEE